MSIKELSQSILDASKAVIELSEMKIDELKKFHKDINSGIYDVLSAKQSVNHKKSFGSTSPSMVKKAATKWVNKLHNEKK